MTALSCDALGRFLAGSVFQSLRDRTEFRITALTQRKEIPGQRRLINAVLFAGSTLNSFKLGDGEVGAVNVETSVRAVNLQHVGMYPVHQNVDVQIIRVLMHCVDGLMLFPFHKLEEISDGFWCFRFWEDIYRKNDIVCQQKRKLLSIGFLWTNIYFVKNKKWKIFQIIKKSFLSRYIRE